jgi:hypothetical protein
MMVLPVLIWQRVTPHATKGKLAFCDAPEKFWSSPERIARNAEGPKRRVIFVTIHLDPVDLVFLQG